MSNPFAHPHESLSRASRIEDARGRAVTQLDPVRRHLPDARSAIEAEDLEAIVRELERGCPRTRRLLVAAGLGLALLALIGAGVLFALQGTAAWRDLFDTLRDPAIMAPNLVLLAYFTWLAQARRRGRRRRVRAVLLKHRCCPHCGYSLRGLPVDADDGATVCPECACAWRLDDPAMARFADGRATCSMGTCARGWTVATAVGLLTLSAGGALLVYLMTT